MSPKWMFWPKSKFEYFLYGGKNVDHGVSPFFAHDGIDQYKNYGGITSGAIQTIAKHPISGNIYMGGSFREDGGSVGNRIAMWDGSNFYALGTGFNDTVWKIVFDPNGNLYATGNFSSAGGVPVSRIAMWNGSNWTNLGDGVSVATRGMVWHNGLLYVGTRNVGADAGPSVWNGTSWALHDNRYRGISGTINEILFDDNDDMYVAGTFGSYIADYPSGTSDILSQHVTKYENGEWKKMGPIISGYSGLASTANGMAKDDSNNIYIVGLFQGTVGQWGNVHLFSQRVIKYINTTNSWEAQNTGFLNSGAIGNARFKNGELYMTGGSLSHSSLTSCGLTKWNGTVLKSLFPTVNINAIGEIMFI